MVHFTQDDLYRLRVGTKGRAPTIYSQGRPLWSSNHATVVKTIYPNLSHIEDDIAIF